MLADSVHLLCSLNKISTILHCTSVFMCICICVCCISSLLFLTRQYFALCGKMVVLVNAVWGEYKFMLRAAKIPCFSCMRTALSRHNPLNNGTLSSKIVCNKYRRNKSPFYSHNKDFPIFPVPRKLSFQPCSVYISIASTTLIQIVLSY